MEERKHELLSPALSSLGSDEGEEDRVQFPYFKGNAAMPWAGMNCAVGAGNSEVRDAKKRRVIVIATNNSRNELGLDWGGLGALGRDYVAAPGTGALRFGSF